MCLYLILLFMVEKLWWNHTIYDYSSFQTSDLSLPHGMTAPSVVMMSGYPSRFTADDIKTSLAARVNDTSKFPIDVSMNMLSYPKFSQVLASTYLLQMYENNFQALHTDTGSRF